MRGEQVVLINAFEVPEGQDEAFIRGWEQARGFLRTQPGYLSSSLHRSISPGADFRFVNVARWASERAFRAATTRPEFRAAAPPYPFHASLYRVATTDEPPDVPSPGALTGPVGRQEQS